MEKWEEYLTKIDNTANNVEYLESMSSKTEVNTTYEQVLRSLKLLDDEIESMNMSPYNEEKSAIPYITDHYCKIGKSYDAKLSIAVRSYLFDIVREVLQWMDVSKSEGVLVNHNIKSADIYLKERSYHDYSLHNIIVENLIASHGLIGQSIRGETPLLASSKYFKIVSKYLSYNELRFVLEELNYCIIAGVSSKLYENISYQVSYVIAKNMETFPNNCGMKAEAYNNANRFLKLMGNKKADGEIVKFNDNSYKERLDERISQFLSKYDLWFFQPAMEHFSFNDVALFLEYINNTIGKFDSSIKAVSFKDMADTLYYDYKDKKHLNIYKVRLIEYHIHNGFNSDHVNIVIDPEADSQYADIRIVFTEAAESLVNFCIAAEISESATYNKCIRILYDALNLRKDKFDRLNNEDDYIEDMNDNTESSTKSLILDYIPEDAKYVADIGPGGGELIDKLDDRFILSAIDGYEISDAMIKKLESRFLFNPNVNIINRNIVYGPLENKYDCIIFSSILHEIYSYTEYEPGKRFCIENIELALHNAYESLNDNGTIIIRDGVKCSDDMVIMYMTKDCMLTFVNYSTDFKGNTTRIAMHLGETGDEKFPYKIEISKDYAREFMYTYTWGPEAYANEVQEQFGYYTENEFLEILKDIGYTIQYHTVVLEPGYEEHLKDSCYITDKNGNKLDYPDSTVFIVAKKENNNE